MTEPSRYDAGTVSDDQLLHAVAQRGMSKHALCGAGHIRHTMPIPFVPGAGDLCRVCEEMVQV